MGSEVVCLFLLSLFWNPKKLGGMWKVFISVKTTRASAEKATHPQAASTEIHTATPWIAMSPAKPRICLEGLLRGGRALHRSPRLTFPFHALLSGHASVPDTPRAMPEYTGSVSREKRRREGGTQSRVGKLPWSAGPGGSDHFDKTLTTRAEKAGGGKISPAKKSLGKAGNSRYHFSLPKQFHSQFSLRYANTA